MVKEPDEISPEMEKLIEENSALKENNKMLSKIIYIYDE
jgi:hypothetical protein